MSAQRLQIISDIHIDYRGNREMLLGLSDQQFQQDILVIAGDATDDLLLLASFFEAMLRKFRQLVFVPGNHELWVKRGEHSDSSQKFADILALCRSLGVVTQPLKIGVQTPLWIVPLFSWYHTAEHPHLSLFRKKDGVEDKTFDMWTDFYATRWPEDISRDIGSYFLAMNQSCLEQRYDAPVVSVSHFLPRQELMLSTPEERAANQLNYKDTHPEFNFSHVAGSQGIETQLRALGSRVHVYGHQHRNRCRDIDGVTYLSHCMGYPKERQRGLIAPECERPKVIWQDGEGLLL